MQLEDLQSQWQRLDQKLERTLKLESELLRLTVTSAVRRRIRTLAFWPAFDVVLSLGLVIATGFFLEVHWENGPLLATATVLMVAAVLLLIDSVRQLELTSRIDWDAPVARIQSGLSQLRIQKIRQFKWVILLAPLVGFCAFIVGLQWLLDRLHAQELILDKLNPAWVIANYAFGLLFIPFGQLAIRFIAKRFGNRGWWQNALDAVAGTSMTTARAELDRWSSLDREPEDESK
jgi:hypothetical protein